MLTGDVECYRHRDGERGYIVHEGREQGPHQKHAGDSDRNETDVGNEPRRHRLGAAGIFHGSPNDENGRHDQHRRRSEAGERFIQRHEARRPGEKQRDKGHGVRADSVADKHCEGQKHDGGTEKGIAHRGIIAARLAGASDPIFNPAGVS